MRTVTDTTDPTLIMRVRTPLTSKALIQMAAIVEMRPNHTVHTEGDWLVLRLPNSDIETQGETQ